MHPSRRTVLRTGLGAAAVLPLDRRLRGSATLLATAWFVDSENGLGRSVHPDSQITVGATARGLSRISRGLGERRRHLERQRHLRHGVPDRLARHGARRPRRQPPGAAGHLHPALETAAVGTWGGAGNVADTDAAAGWRSAPSHPLPAGQKDLQGITVPATLPGFGPVVD